MINLLPPEQKEELREEEKLKLVFIFGTISLAFLISLSLILFLINISILTEVGIQKIYLAERERELQMSKIQEFKGVIEELNSTFSDLNYFYQNQFDITEILLNISETLPSGTYLTNLGLNLENGKFKVDISGFCPTREVLLTLKTNLENEGAFSEVYFPPSNWVEPSDINFTVNLVVNR